MKKIFILALSILLLTTTVWASKWSDYGALTTIAAGDTFLVLDVSDTSLAASGTQKEFAWSALLTNLETANYCNTDDTETISVKWTFDDNIFILESATADADVVGDGQIWVKSSAPNVLMFTDDAGNDRTVGTLESAQTYTGNKIFSGTVGLPANCVDSASYVDGSIDLAHLSVNSVDSDQYVDGSIDVAHMSANSIDSDQYVDASIDLAHMSAESIDSDQYVDASIDTDHLSASCVDSANYILASIDLEHMSAESVDSDQYVDDSIDAVHIADFYAYDKIKIEDMKDGTSAPAALDDASTRTPYAYRAFAADADEDLNYVWAVPSDLSGTVVQFRVYYLITNATGPTAEEGVAFGLSGISAGDNDATNGTKGTVVVITDDTLNAVQHDVMITGWSGDVTITALAAGELAELALIRDVDDAVDDYAQDVGVVMMQIRYVQNLAK